MNERLEEIENKLLQATNEDDEDVVYASICAEAVLEDLQWTVGYAKKQAERVAELEKEFELCDSTMHMIDMTINNPSTSDDDKWEKVKKTMKKYYADDCIHCNGKGFNGLDYCPNCVRGEVIQKNMELEHQNKRYRELLTSKIMKDLIRLESKGCFLPDGKRTDFMNLKLAVEALESESE